MITYPTNKLQKVLLSGGCEQRNLPSGYTQVEYLQSSGTQYIDTGYVPLIGDAITVKYKHTVLPTVGNGNQALFSAGIGTYQLIALCSIITDTINGLWFKYFTTGIAEKVNYNPVINVWYNLQITNYGLATINDNSAISTPEQELDGNDINMFIFCRRNGENPFLGAIRGFTVSRNGSNVLNLIPARRNYDNILGMYDTVSGTFLTNAGTGTFIAGPDVVPTPDYPIDIVCNNGVVKVSPNLFNENDIALGYFYDDNGTYTENANTFTSSKIPMNAVTTVTFYRSLNVGNVYLRIHAFNSSNNWIGLVAKSASTSSLMCTGTTPANTSYIRVCGAKRLSGDEIDNECQVELGSTATPYHPYGQIYTDGTQEVVTDNLGNTADAERLLGIGDYKDTQSVLDGKITRNIGIKVLDGTEDWIKAEGGVTRFYLILSEKSYNVNEPFTPYCTHCQGCLSARGSQNTVGGTTDGVGFWYDDTAYVKHYELYLRFGSITSITDASTLKTYLANQYANDTPVIIVYLLAEPTTEQVTPQPLAGNTATITAGSIDNLPIESSTIAELKKRYIGANEVNKVYIGNNLVWENN